MDTYLYVKGQNSTHSYAVYTRNFALHFEVVWLETPQVQLEISAGCGMGQRPLKSPQSSVKSLVWWLIWRVGGLEVLEYPVEWVAMKILSII